MTQQERDTAIRILREQLQQAKLDRVAALTELRGHCDTFRSLCETCDGILRDGSLQANPPAVPADVPSSARLTYLFNELRQATERIARRTEDLQQAGHPVP